ncbi:MAG: hypothetical protein QM723_03545 [Myxococcaceae bacterium]
MATEGRTPEFENARMVLLEWLDFALTTPRKRSPVEAPMVKTARYLKLEAAWAFERLGFVTDASQLSVDALSELRQLGPTEAAMAELYRRRLSEARDNLAPAQWSDSAISDVLSSLDTWPEYRVRRVIEASFALSSNTCPASIEGFYAGRSSRCPWRARPIVEAQSIEEAIASFERSRRPDQLRLYACRDSGTLLEVIQATEALWPRVSDTYNTNDYYCFTVLAVFSAITFSIAQSVNPIPLSDG